jgi:hypothetical protein
MGHELTDALGSADSAPWTQPPVPTCDNFLYCIKGQRKRVKRALELSGFETYPIPTVVDDVLRLVALLAPTATGKAGPG